MNFEKQVSDLANTIFEQIYSFIEENKGNDDQFYKCAILKLDDDRKIVAYFDKTERHAISTSTYEPYHGVDDIEKEYFCLWKRKDDCGVVLDVTFANMREIYMRITSQGLEIDQNDEKLVLQYLEHLCQKLKTLTYDTESTHKDENMKYEVLKEKRENDYRERLNQLSSDCDVFPSVKAAVDFWADTVCDNVDEFKKELSDRIMYKLSTGEKVCLECDWRPVDTLAEAMKMANTSINGPYKITMLVDLDRVVVNGDEIFSTQTQEFDDVKPKSY